MFVFNVERFVPKFILADKNGYAIAKAIEAAMQIMNNTINDGLKCVYDFDSMPEWRLDELAWETNCLYDYHADVEVKREWIRNAVPLYRLFGTPEAIYKYVGSYFNEIEVEENWQYNGSPFHFRVTVDGEWTPDNEAWARKAIGDAKNVRSVLDAIQIGSKILLGISTESEVLARFNYPMTATDNYAGRWPQENTIGIVDDTPQQAINANVDDYRFPYEMAGTVPDINTIGEVDNSEIEAAQADDIVAMIYYKMCGLDE